MIDLISGSAAETATVEEFVFADSANAGRTFWGKIAKRISVQEGMFHSWIFSVSTLFS
jgi:hypothetical protein